MFSITAGYFFFRAYKENVFVLFSAALVRLGINEKVQKMQFASKRKFDPIILGWILFLDFWLTKKENS